MAMKRLAVFVLWLVTAGAGCCNFDLDRPFEERFQPEESSLGPIDAKAQDTGANDAGTDDGGQHAIVAPPVNRGEAHGVRKCCSAIAANAKTAPKEQQETYQAAIAECSKAVNMPAEGDAGRPNFEKVRKILVDVGYPSACQ